VFLSQTNQWHAAINQIIQLQQKNNNQKPQIKHELDKEKVTKITHNEGIIEWSKDTSNTKTCSPSNVNNQLTATV
jgi:hypothetical protein